MRLSAMILNHEHFTTETDIQIMKTEICDSIHEYAVYTMPIAPCTLSYHDE